MPYVMKTGKQTTCLTSKLLYYVEALEVKRAEICVTSDSCHVKQCFLYQ